MLLRFWALPMVLALVLQVEAPCATINVGIISFDVLIAGDAQTVGVSAFNISNLTGVFALPPDFPVTNAVAFENGSLDLSSFFINVGNVVPGSDGPLASLTFPDSQMFPSATFTGRLSQTTFVLADGSTFVAASQIVTASIQPTVGSSLTPGIEFALITVSDVPEPATAGLTFAAVLAMIVLTRRGRAGKGERN